MTQPPYGAPNAGAPGQYPFDPGSTTSPSPPRTTKVSARRIAVIAGVAVVVLVGSPLAFMAGRASAVGSPATSTAPTPAPATGATGTKATTAATTARASASPTTETVCAGGTLTGAVWSAKAPTGWQCSGPQALGLSLASSTKDTITLLVTPAPDDSACDSALSVLPKLVTLPEVAWGGQVATAAERDLSGTVLSYRCTIRDGRMYLMTATPITGTSDSVRTALDAVVASWTWK